MNITIKNEDNFYKIKNKILNDGFDKLHVLADFDRTLTYGLLGGLKTSSLISILESSCQLGPDYSKMAGELFDKYHPIEIDLKIPFEERKIKMLEWWNKIYELLIKNKLNKSDLEISISKSSLKLREGVVDFLSFLNDKNIPLIIFSAAGCGEMIKIFLEKNNCAYPNIYYIVNSFNWDENGRAISIKEPVIHSLNKDETVLSDFPEAFNLVKDRKNVLLLGDNIGDIGMINGFNFDTLLKVGFLNFNINENYQVYSDSFDAVVEGDGDFSFVQSIFDISEPTSLD